MVENLILWILLLVVDLFLVVVAFRLFGKNGLYAAIAMNIILANIQVMKTVEILGWVLTLGNVLYGAIFLCTDILCELYGKEEARKGVWIGFFVLIATTILMQLSLWFIPAAGDFAHPHLEALFSLLPRIAAASLIAYVISQNHDIWAFSVLKKKMNGKMLWFRNNISTMVSQGIDSVIFTTIAFWGVWGFDIWISILITTYVMKFFVAAADTPFLYLAKKIAPKGE